MATKRTSTKKATKRTARKSTKASPRRAAKRRLTAGEAIDVVMRKAGKNGTAEIDRDGSLYVISARGNRRKVGAVQNPTFAREAIDFYLARRKK